MLPKLLIIAFIFGLNRISAQQDIIKNATNNSIIENPLTFRYDYTIIGKNNSYEKRSEYGNEKESKGNYFIQLPSEDDTKYEVHYTANNWGFHPVVRLSMKNNHSEVTSHFSRNDNSINSSNNKNDEIYYDENNKNTSTIKKNYIQYDESADEQQDNNHDEKDTTISLNKIISNMFSKGIINFLSTKSIATPIKSDNNNDDDDDDIPSESLDDIIIDNTKIRNSDVDNIVKLNVPVNIENITRTTTEATIIYDGADRNFQNTTSNIFVTHVKNENPSLILPSIPTTLINIPINNSSSFKQNESKENYVSDEDVLEINDAAETYKNFKEKSLYMEQSILPNNINIIKEKLVEYIYPNNTSSDSFDLPIIVEENPYNVNEKIHEDNLIAEESQKNHVEKYLLQPTPTEVNIIPSREQFINIPRAKSEKQFNVQILKENLKPSQDKYINGKKIFIPTHELDSYHENVEKDLSIEDNKYTTEASSRKFLKHFNLKLSPSGIIKERKYTTTIKSITSAALLRSTIPPLRYSVTPPTPTKINGNLRITPAVFTNLLPPHKEISIDNKIIVNVDITTPIPLKKNRGKTFVEIQKSINVHNLLIKEDNNGKFIEQHEEYIKPNHRTMFKEFKTLQQSNKYLPPTKPITQDNPHQSTVIPPKTITIPFPTHGQNFNLKSSKEKVVERVIPVEEKVLVPYAVEKFIDRPIHVTKYVDRPYPVEKITEKLVPYPVQQIVEKPIDRPYPVDRPYQVTVEKIVEVPVEKVVEKYLPQKIIEVPKIVEKIVAVEKKVPIPYPVEKYVDRPIHITKYVDRPYPVEKVREKLVPYPVQQIVEKPIDRPYPVDRPYPITVEKIVEKKVPVEHIVEKFVDRPIPYPVEVKQYIPQPYPVEQIIEKIIDRPVEVEKIVEKQVQVPVEVERVVEKFIDRNITVEKIVDRPVEVEKIVEKIIDRPVPVAYPIHVPIHIPYHIPVAVPIPNPKINFHRNNYHHNKIKSNLQLFSDIQFPYLSGNSGNTLELSRELFTLVQPTPPQINAVNFFNQPSLNRPFFKFPNRYIPEHHQISSSPTLSLTGPLPSETQYAPIKYAKNFGYKTILPIQTNDYFGPVPLANDYSQWQKYFSSNGNVDGISIVHKRSSDFGRNLRVEYGFKPPLIPSIETDDQGVPIEKKD